MPRRRQHTDAVGSRLQLARRDVRRTLAQVAKATGVNASSLSKFENGLSTPSFDDVSRLAQFYGWPLIFFATGRLRTGDDPRELVAQLYYWGLRDLEVRPRRPLVGELRAFENLVAEAADTPDARLVEALPGLLLRNDFLPSELLKAACRQETVKEVGWLSQVAHIISQQLDVDLGRPGAAGRVNRTWTSARSELARAGAETTSGEDDEQAPTSDRLARRWQVESAITFHEFKTRARAILEAPR